MSSHWLRIALCTSLLGSLVAGCGGETANAPEPTTPAPAPTETAPPTAVTPEPIGTDAPAAPPAGKRPPCKADQECNGDPAVSALWGRCDKETGTCACNAGFELAPWGKCQPVK